MLAAIRRCLQSLWPSLFAAAPLGPVDREAILPFELYLTIGFGSVRLFEAGPIDEFRFFQRSGVPGGHGMEFLSRLDPADAGSENYKPYGLFRLEPERARSLFDADEVSRLWSILQECGVARPPDAASFAGAALQSYDPRRPGSEGTNRLVAAAGARASARRGRRRLSYGEVLDILRDVMAPREKIAWIEDAFSDPPAPGEIVHRYYLGTNRQAYVVRDHWETGKSLFEAETSAEAIAVCLSSGNYSRLRAA